MTIPNDATLAQIRAADPASSTWVSANAGSGKTRVLTDRVARLLLHETPPQRILCLTYTKAAASHMQIQLFDRLGSWAMLPDAALTEKLVDLGEPGASITPDFLRMARTLFARALETPGGLKIQTIHSFCAALLRRFPLEAGVSPQFQEMDERSDKKLRADILETLADRPNPDAFDGIATYLSGDDADTLARQVAKNRAAFAKGATKAEIWQAFELPVGYDQTIYLAEVLPDWAQDVLEDLIEPLKTGTVTDERNAAKIQSLDLGNPDLETATVLEGIFVFKNDQKLKAPNAAKIGSFPTETVRKNYPYLIEAVQHLMLGFEAGKARRQSLMAAERTWALHQFANAFLPEYATRKQAHGWLDFDDLILKARALLTESGMAQWVLFKMDGGIDHILVDEAQDTSPDQWAVIAKLAEEFSVGHGARDIARTLFVVGDEKQSIYSFQGADPHAFDRMRQHFDARLKDVNETLAHRELLYSFRSSPAILRLVDQVMLSDNSVLTSNVTHRAFHATLPGRVDLWPFHEKPEKDDKPVWYDPVDSPSANDPSLDLAKDIARHIREILDAKTVIPSAKGNRLVVPGDFLILVQRRSDLFHEIIKALKVESLPVAGADRLRIGAELAVRDLTALLAFLETPEDDLSLAAALRSPLLGFSQSDLFHLAHDRKGWLWARLRGMAEQYPTVLEILNDLRKQTDFLRPYELLERILTRHKGRENLIARLGREAEEGVDGLLAQALDYEQVEPPSLTGFLGWMSTDDSDIKRQMESRSREIRVMTVHGAKGLESPIVILPDTAERRLPQGDLVLPLASGLPSWKLSKPEAPDLMHSALVARETAQKEERMRLLYVAITRAENWLIVCGAGEQGKELTSWYNQIKAAMTAAPASAFLFSMGLGLRFQTGNWDAAADFIPAQDAQANQGLPNWALEPAPAFVHPVKPSSPSDLGGAKIVSGADDGLTEDAAKRRGSLIHLLLEHLPGVEPTHRSNVASRILAAENALADLSTLQPEVELVLDAPDLAFLFSENSLSEVPISAMFKNTPIYGIIDRLIVTPNRILAVDFKSNAVVPDTPAQTPEGILRQMAAYRAGLGEIWPGRQIDTAIVWTRTATFMELPHDIVTDAGARATIS